MSVLRLWAVLACVAWATSGAFAQKTDPFGAKPAQPSKTTKNRQPKNTEPKKEIVQINSEEDLEKLFALQARLERLNEAETDSLMAHIEEKYLQVLHESENYDIDPETEMLLEWYFQQNGGKPVELELVRRNPK